jgi:hypothetical protein
MLIDGAGCMEKPQAGKWKFRVTVWDNNRKIVAQKDFDNQISADVFAEQYNPERHPKLYSKLDVRPIHVT